MKKINGFHNLKLLFVAAMIISAILCGSACSLYPNKADPKDRYEQEQYPKSDNTSDTPSASSASSSHSGASADTPAPSSTTSPDKTASSGTTSPDKPASSITTSADTPASSGATSTGTSSSPETPAPTSTSSPDGNEPAIAAAGIDPAQPDPDKSYEDVYYLTFADFSAWESGDFEETTGNKIDNTRRLRLSETLEIPYDECDVSMGSSDYVVSVFQYDRNNAFIGFDDLKSGDKLIRKPGSVYFRLCLYRTYSEKQLSPGQWRKIFNDVKLVISRGDLETILNADKGNLIIAPNADPVSGSVIRDYILAGKDDEAASALWDNYVLSGRYSLEKEKLPADRLTLYFSENGDDDNSGLSSDYPKKSFYKYSGVSNINLLLKCGDTFYMPETFMPGSNVMIAAYGEGERPVLDYYSDLDCVFTESSGKENVWEADLKPLSIYDGAAVSKDNCNIGQLLINGEINWNRFVWSSKEDFDIEKIEEDSWAVDWLQSKLYIYSETDPSGLSIKYSSASHGILLNNADNIVIKGIEMIGVGRHGIDMSNADNITIEACYLHNIGGSVLRQAGIRYGNAIQLWESGENISVKYNYASWVFDTCFTNQGQDDNAYEKNVSFEYNIGCHSFWGIETWGEWGNNAFSDISYNDNIIFDNIDITNPHFSMYAKAGGWLLENRPYHSYRGGYQFHQMSALNVSLPDSGALTVKDNIFWNTNRFIFYLTSEIDENISKISGNLFFAETDHEHAAVFRYNKDGTNKNYTESLFGFAGYDNLESIHFIEENYQATDEMSLFAEKLDRISGY